MLSQHEGVKVPPNVPHQILNESDAYGWLRLRNLEFLVISQSPSSGDRVLVS
ncbi:hypothetical protein NSTCB13_02977 [Nostoc sp. DSM 114160]|jgi:hypothetical protein